MSIVEDLGARIRTSVDELPLTAATIADERLRLAMGLLLWVRQESIHDVGAAALAGASEHLASAVLALRTAADQLTEYLGEIGLGAASPSAPGQPLPTTVVPRPQAPRPAIQVDSTPLENWWATRIDELTEQPAPAPDATTDRTPDQSARSREPAGRATASTPVELLRHTVPMVTARDRPALARYLRTVPVHVGLGLSVVSPPLARHLADAVLGEHPRDDREALSRQLDGDLHRVLPGLPVQIRDTVLARACVGQSRPRSQPRNPTQTEPEVDHPTDAAVASAVLVGLLLQRLGRDEHDLDRLLPDPTTTNHRHG